MRETEPLDPGTLAGVVARTALLLVLVAALAAPPAAARPRLKAFDSCAGLVRYEQRHAEGVVTPPERMPIAAPEVDDHSTTNVQEGGVDEPDTVKTDGRRLFAVAGGSLHVVDARARPPRRLDSLKLPEGVQHELLLHGDRVLVLTQLGGFGIEEPGLIRPSPIWRAATMLSEIAVSDAGALRLLRTLEADGSYVSARLTGATARVVIAATGVPGGTLTTARGERRIRRLVRCRAVRHARVFSGLQMVTVLSVDMEKGLPAVDADALLTSAQTVYASRGSLYVASRRWSDPRRTEIHRFDASERGRTVYRSSGAVPGYLLSQWALSEHAGHLRVASTDSESHVTILRERDKRLAEIGRVSGLGPGEQIHGVRFIGDAGYVVTFRQTDPLYVVDLADPEHPRVRGELKMLGYSAYLHPVGADLLLGVGQDATEQGRRRGTQISLFDVSDPTQPRRLHQRALAPNSFSAVEWDHRAFLYWPADRLAVVPVEQAAAGFAVTRQGIDGRGSVSQPGTITRSAVIGGRLFTVSELGVTASPLATLSGGSWLPW